MFAAVFILSVLALLASRLFEVIDMVTTTPLHAGILVVIIVSSILLVLRPPKEISNIIRRIGLMSLVSHFSKSLSSENYIACSYFCHFSDLIDSRL